MVFQIFILFWSISYVTAWIIGPNAVSWDDAEAYCVSQGSHLATITNEIERNETKAFCQLNDDDDNAYGCWIGLFQDDATSTWQWTDGSALGYGFSNGNPTQGIDPWFPGEPSAYYLEYCIQIYREQGYTWNDAVCDATNLPLCNDPIEMTYFKGPTTGDYFNASSYCESQGTTLASIVTQNEWNNAKSICGSDSCWIGLRDDFNGNPDMVWSWDDGSNIGMSYGFNVDRTAKTGQGPWNTNEPNEFRGFDEDCVLMYPNTGKYNDAVCDYTSNIYPLCNKAPPLPPPPRYVKGSMSGSYYDAAAYCQSQEGTTLASIVTEAEWNDAKDTCGATDCWIGLRDDLNGNDDNNWAWDDGSDIANSYGFNSDQTATIGQGPWNTNEPNEFRGLPEDCVLMYANTGKYNDAQCDYASNVYPLCSAPCIDSDCGDNAGCGVSGECVCDTGFDGNPNILCRPLTCPDGYEQVGPINADVAGCGLEGCEARYQDNYVNIEDCIAGCEADPECLSFSWAPLGGDKSHPTKTVCTLYKKTTYTQIWGPNQILCAAQQYNIAEAQTNDKMVDGNDHIITNGANINESQNRVFIIIGCIASALCILCMIFGVYLYRRKNKGYSIHKYVTKTEDEDMDDIIDGDGDDEDIEMTTCNNDLVDEETQMNIE